MAGVTFDAGSIGSATSGTSLSVSHTCTGSNLVLVVSAMGNGDVTVSSVTYNGVAMTEVSGASGSSGIIAQVKHWYLVNPATGANNIVATFSGTLSSGRIAVHGASFTGADQTAPITNSAVDSGEPIDGDITTTVGNSMLLESIANGSGFTLSYTDSQTEINKQESGPNTYLAYKKVTTAGAYQMRVSFTGGSSNRISVVSAIRPVNVTITESDTASVSDSQVGNLDLKQSDTHTPTDTGTDTVDDNVWNNQSKSSSSWTNQSKS